MPAFFPVVVGLAAAAFPSITPDRANGSYLLLLTWIWEAASEIHYREHTLLGSGGDLTLFRSPSAETLDASGNWRAIRKDFSITSKTNGRYVGGKSICTFHYHEWAKKGGAWKGRGQFSFAAGGPAHALLTSESELNCHWQVTRHRFPFRFSGDVSWDWAHFIFSPGYCSL